MATGLLQTKYSSVKIQYYALTLSVREELLFDYGIWNLQHVESCHTHTLGHFLRSPHTTNKPPLDVLGASEADSKCIPF